MGTMRRLLRRSAACGAGALLCATLAGCGSGDPQGCRLETVADLPMLPHQSIPAVEATLGDQKVILQIDTGAFLSSLSQSGADRFDLRPGPDARYTSIVGVGGVISAPIVTVRQLGLGHGIAHDLELPVDARMTRSVNGVPILGLFGADFLSNYDVDIDVPAHHFGMYRPIGCSADLAPFDQPYTEVPFHYDAQEGESKAVMLDARLNGVPITVQLDTGASGTVLTPFDAAAAGVTREMLASDPTRSGSGVDGRRVIGRVHRFTLEIGDQEMKNVPIMVASFQNGRALLGNDFLRHNRVLISYWRHKLFIQPATSDSSNP